ncbi:MAG: c-type cytochrome domain-containing protein, partial [Planctomycetota bacterium]
MDFRIPILLSVLSFAASLRAEDVSFSRDVLPVLSDRCFHCHGPDETHREADLRLDLETFAKEDLGGYAPIRPGDLEQSEIWQRITSDDPDSVMPPPDSHRKPLTANERAAIRRWILAGAEWGKHWSFEPLSRPTLPETDEHPVDAFIIARLAESGLRLSPPAEPHTLSRRLSFDLTGLPPTVEQVRRLDGATD